MSGSQRKPHPPKPAVPPERDPVTDHALLRWMERHFGMDVEGLRTELRDAVTPYIQSGAKLVHKDKLIYLFRSGRLITVLPGGRDNLERAHELRDHWDRKGHHD